MSSLILRILLFSLKYLEAIYQYYLITTIISSVLLLIGVLFPLNWTKKLQDVGFIESEGDCLIKRISGKTGRRIGKVPPVYPNGWFMICEASDIKKGQVHYVEALGEHLAVLRGEVSGTIHVLDAYCPHNGANMAIGGRVTSDCLQCPFHHWKFDATTGSCIEIPYSSKVPSFARVKRWISHEVNDLIFIWYHAEKEEPSWHVKSIEEIKKNKFKFHGRNEFIVNCHIQEIPENGGDLSHFNAVHTATMLGGSDLRTLQRGIYGILKHIWTAEWEAGSKAGVRHIGFGKLHHEMMFANRFIVTPNDVDICQIGPGYVELIVNSPYGPVIILQTVTPIAPLLQKIVHRVYCPPSLSLYATFLLIAESIMIERDIMVWNNKTYVDTPMVVSEEQTLVKHRRWYSQFYTEHSPKFQQCHSTDSDFY